MTARVFQVNPLNPEPGPLARAAEALRRGLLVAYPTETFYGLACDPFSDEAVARIFIAKGRPPALALPLIAAGREAVRLCTREIPPAAHALMDAFWPGPLTLVLPAADNLPARLLGGGHTVGIRVSPHPVAMGLARAAGGPIVATSANRSGQPPPLSAGEVLSALGDDVAIVIDAGPATGGVASTVLNMTSNPPHIVRAGALSGASIEKVLGRRLG